MARRVVRAADLVPQLGRAAPVATELQPVWFSELAPHLAGGSLLGSSTYEWLLHHASSQLAGTYAFVCPLVAVVLGWWLLGEQISGRTLLAAAAISAGVALVMLHPEGTKARTKQAPGPAAAAGPVRSADGP
jgi:drug/metabolite transporter (DMT)-like permease